jgi:SAM-dependent methyltransferase
VSDSALRWREQLEAWALPDALLGTAEDDPYGWPQALWRRRSESAGAEETPTSDVVARLLGEHGTLIDVGAGRGRVSLRFALAGHTLVAVEPDPGMAAGLAEDATAAGVAVQIIQERWPQAAGSVAPAEVAVSAHVVYDVADIGPFLSAMSRTATAGVVVEMSETHPWSDLAPLYRQIHGLERPTGPSADDLVAVVQEVLGIEPTVARWSRPGQLWFESWDEICDFYGRRLIVPRAERPGLRSLLAERVVDLDGRLIVGENDRRLVTLWWPTA